MLAESEREEQKAKRAVIVFRLDPSPWDGSGKLTLGTERYFENVYQLKQLHRGVHSPFFLSSAAAREMR